MLKIHTRYHLLWIAAAVVGFTALTILGCAGSTQTDKSTAATTDTEAVAAVPAKTGNQLWSENCAMCHNSRDPGEFSDAQWAVIGDHMRLQANLTGKQEREIIKFLQAAN